MAASLLIKNAATRGSSSLSDILIEGNLIKNVAPNIRADADSTIDIRGNLVLPSFSDMHLHLDSAMTVGVPHYNESGTLQEGIAIWGEYKKTIRKDDLKRRAKLACEWCASYGTTRIRTHADITEPTLTALKGLLELKSEIRDIVDLEVTAFPQDGILTEPGNLELLEKAMEMGADNVGLIPHIEYTREDGVKSVEKAFEMAKKYGRRVDGHVDETDDEMSRFLEVVAACAIRSGYEGKVTAGHATAMHSYNNAYAARLFTLLKRADVTVVPNPSINIHLQGRYDTYPKRRGMARIKELIQNGVNVALGNDCMMDPWYPLGRGDILQSLFIGIHVGQLTGREELLSCLDLVTINSAKALGISEHYGIAPGKAADLVVLDAHDEISTIRDQPARLLVIKQGKIIARTAGRDSTIVRGGKELPLQPLT